MTAEIAILNKSAVALAADSKVTLSQGGRQKTYDTVDKLFSLSKTEPVGAMIYGNAEFIGFPWETIVKEYRRRNPLAVFPTVFAWADNFLEFLTRFFEFRPDDEDRVAISIAQGWVSSVVAQAFNGATGPDDFKQRLGGVLAETVAELEQAPVFVSDGEWAALQARISPSIDRLCASGLMVQFADQQASLMPLVELGIRRSMASPASTGLVIAGFGETDLLPSLVSYSIDGILGGRLKHVETERHDMTRQSDGVILPFAQTDMVERFMQGIDPAYAMLIHESVGQLILQNVSDAAKALGHSDAEVNALMAAFEAAASSAVQMFWDAHERHRRDRFASPIIDMVMSLPKDELANVAESLVSLTSLQRRVSRELETVGGAIDVAVISKGDGFVWIKRKHYFNPDRNLRFVNAYFSEHNRVQTRGGRADADDDG